MKTRPTLLVPCMLLATCYADRFVAPNLDCSGDDCVCREGFGDCDGVVENGCETALVDNPDHCGACGSPCINGVCHVDQCGCLPGYADCDADPQNGCEAQLEVASEHCGACGHDCLGGACSASRCQAAQFATLAPYWTAAIAVWPPYVYAGGRTVETNPVGTVAAIPLEGGPPEIIADGEEVQCVAASATDVFWRTTSQVWRASHSTHEPVLVADGIAPPQEKTARCIAATNGYVYWLYEQGALSTGVARASVAGGAVESIQTDMSDYSSLVADADAAYWTAGTDVWRLADGSSTPESIAQSADHSFGDLAVGGDYVYATDQFPQSILRIPRAGGESITIATEAGLPLTITADSSHVFWSDFGGRISMANPDGAERTELGTDFGLAFFLVTHEDQLYWVTALTAVVMRLVR